MDGKPFADPHAIEIVTVFAARAGEELERKMKNRKWKIENGKLKDLTCKVNKLASL